MARSAQVEKRGESALVERQSNPHSQTHRADEHYAAADDDDDGNGGDGGDEGFRRWWWWWWWCEGNDAVKVKLNCSQ